MNTNPAYRGTRRAFLLHPLSLFLACLVIMLLAIAVATARENDNRRGPGGQQGPPPASEIARHIMAEFDTNKNGVLDLEELTAHIEAMHRRHGPPPHARAPQQGGNADGFQGSSSQGGRPKGPPPFQR